MDARLRLVGNADGANAAGVWTTLKELTGMEREARDCINGSCRFRSFVNKRGHIKTMKTPRSGTKITRRPKVCFDSAERLLAWQLAA